MISLPARAETATTVERGVGSPLRRTARAVLAVLFGSFVAWPCAAGTIGLAWDPVAGVAGYWIFYGTSPTYTGQIDVGSATAHTVTGLTDCTGYYLAVKAYDLQGNTGATFSNQVSGWARPVVQSATPPRAMQGQQITVDVVGSNFASGSSVEVDNPNVHIDNATVLACDRLQVVATVEPTADGVRAAEVGRFDVTVRTPARVFGTAPDLFEVLVNPARFDIDQRSGPSAGRLDGGDVVWLGRLFGSREGDPLYSTDADLNGDGWLDGEDLAHLAGNLGKCWSGSAWTVTACPAVP